MTVVDSSGARPSSGSVSMKPRTGCAWRQAGSSSRPSRVGACWTRTAVMMGAVRRPAWISADESAAGDCASNTAVIKSTSDDLPDGRAVAIPRYDEGVADAAHARRARRLSGFGQQFFEQGEGPRVVGLAEPEEGLAADFPVWMRSSDADEDGYGINAVLLREREHRLLFHIPVNVAIVDEVSEASRGCVSRRLAEPEHRLAARPAGDMLVPREFQERRPDGLRVGQDGGQNRVLADPTVPSSGEFQEESRCIARRDGPEVGDAGAHGWD